MSTRYVWSRQAAEPHLKSTQNSEQNIYLIQNVAADKVYIQNTSQPTNDGNLVSVDNVSKREMRHNSAHTANYFVLWADNTRYPSTDVLRPTDERIPCLSVWNNDGLWSVYYKPSNGGPLRRYDTWDLIGDVTSVSNASSGAYPADGVSGNYWYTLSGSDNIDASAVGYNTQTPMGGQAITINVTPSTGNVYGGTVRYTYQVQLSGGGWQTIASNQTATSRSYTIPAGTTTFAARVLASDTWGFSSSTYTTGATISVTNNLPPTAPGSISVGSIVAGQAVTITLTAATDSDGTIASYIYERSIDGNGWTQIANVNALTYQDTVGQEWATVAYRAKAVDDDGADGPYATSSTYTVNDGVLYISGPEVEMGTMVKPFTVNMSVGVTGNAAADVAFYVYVDGRCLHDTPVDTGESVPIAIDTRLLSTGDHIITATASKTGYVQASAAYHFETEIAALAGEGYVEQLRDYQGNPIFPRVVAAGIEGINTPTAAAVTLTTSGWVQDGTRYAQTVTVEAVTVETAVVIADCALSDDADANASIIEAWGPVMSYPITQGSSTLTFYVDSVPSINIPVNVGVM